MRRNWIRIIGRPSEPTPTPPVVPTIELKPTIVVSPPAKESRPWWHTFGLIILATVPIIISSIALWISILGYQDQRTASTQQYSRLVTSWVDHLPDNTVRLNVQNLGNGPIDGVFMHLANKGESGSLQNKAILAINDVPPCSIRSLDLSKPMIQQLKISTPPYDINDYFIVIKDLKFADVSGVYWDRNQLNGTLNTTDSVDSNAIYEPTQ